MTITTIPSREPGDPISWARCRAAAERTAAWACANIDAGLPRVNLALYKSLVGLDLAGRAHHAGIVLRLVEQGLYARGDFHAAADDPTPANGRSYRNGWLTWGTHRLGAHHLSVPALDRTARAIHPDIGAVPDNDESMPAQRLYDLGSNASAIQALLAGGRVADAVRVGQFVARLALDQPASAQRLLLATDAQGRPFDPAAAGITAGAEVLTFVVGAPAQVYWTLGFALRALGLLKLATGDALWLDAAQRIGQWLARCHDDQATQITNAKLGWGAAQMFAATADETWADLACRITRQLLATQGVDGVWLRPQFVSAAQQPLPVSLDTSVERMVYLFEIPRLLAAGGRPLPLG